MEISPHDLLESLRSRTCPGCGGMKYSGRSLCLNCFVLLLPDERSNLYRRFGQGYEQAIAAALDRLAPQGGMFRP